LLLSNRASLAFFMALADDTAGPPRGFTTLVNVARDLRDRQPALMTVPDLPIVSSAELASRGARGLRLGLPARAAEADGDREAAFPAGLASYRVGCLDLRLLER